MRCTALLLALAFWTGEVRAQLIVSGSPAVMVVSGAVAGSAPSVVTNSNTTYSITSPGVGKHAITADINTPMPAGVTLKITLGASGGATSDGAITLSTTAQDVVVGITKAASGLPITYVLSATEAAGVVPLQTRRVTLTLVATPE
jgi:hypothetical protein